MIRPLRVTGTAITAVLVALTIASCSGGATTAPGAAEVATRSVSPSATPTPTEHIADSWTFDYQGATGRFKFTGNEADPAVAAVEQARATVSGQPVTLVPVVIDNTAGTESLNMYGITVVTKDGQQIESIDLADKFSSWQDAAGDDADKYNALVDANNKYAMFDLAASAKGTALVAFDRPITSAWRVTVMPAGGFDKVAATAD